MNKYFDPIRAALLASLSVLSAAVASDIPDEYKIGGFALGCQAYTFNRFSVFDAIAKTAEAGGKIIEFYPGQKLSNEEPNLKWDHNASDEMIRKVKEQLDKYAIKAVNYGVVSIPANESEAQKIFEFAKRMGLYGITTESVDNLDTIEKFVKEYNIRVGIHEHARRSNDPSYKIWDPNYVLSLIKDRDSRIGSCADTGHWATSGLKPLECIKILRGRIISSHLKERGAIGPGNHDVVYGTGLTDIKGILDELKSQGFTGNISIEYEFNWEHSVADVAQCIGFVRGYGGATK